MITHTSPAVFTRDERFFRRLAVGGTLTAGVLHLAAALDHGSHRDNLDDAGHGHAGSVALAEQSSAHSTVAGLVLVAAAAQFLLALFLVHSRSWVVVPAGLVGTVGLTVCYVLSRTIGLDWLGHEAPEEASLLGVAVVVVQCVTCGALLTLLPSRLRAAGADLILLSAALLWALWLSGPLR